MKARLKPPLPREEWFFDSLPEDERWACYHYEYARSHEGLSKNLVPRDDDPEVQQKVNDFLTKTLIFDLLHGRYQNGGEEFTFIARRCPEFPGTPWQVIPAHIRKNRVREAPDIKREVYRPVKEFELHKVARDPSSDTAENYVSLNEPPSEFAVVKLDWELSNAELLERFKTILKHRPHPAKKLGGRIKSPLDGLHALGALRLKKHYGSPSKVIAAIYQGLVDLEYSEETALRTAIKRAEKILASI